MEANSIVLPYVVMEEHSVLSSMSLALPNSKFPKHSLWEGSPAKFLKSFEEDPDDNGGSSFYLSDNLRSKPLQWISWLWTLIRNVLGWLLIAFFSIIPGFAVLYFVMSDQGLFGVLDLKPTFLSGVKYFKNDLGEIGTLILTPIALIAR